MSEIRNYLIANPIFFDRMRIEGKEFFFFGRENGILEYYLKRKELWLQSISKGLNIYIVEFV